MKKASITAKAKVELIETEVPEPQGTEVLIKVDLTGVCGSDVPRYLEGQVHSFPQTLGHEFSGTVVAAGPDADQSLVGKRIAGIPLVPCGTCEQCRAGDYALCKTYSFIGSRRQGSMAEYVAVPQTNVIVVDDNVTALEAAFFEPASVALHALHLSGLPNFKGEKRIAVLGAGTIGVLLAQALADYHPSLVVLLNRDDGRLDVAAAAGLENLINTDEDDWRERAQAYTEGKGFTHVFDAIGASASIAWALELAEVHGHICFIGTPKAPVELSVQQWENINRKELWLTGSWMSYSAPWPGVEWSQAVDLFSRGVLSIPDAMIDTIYPLARTAEAFERFRNPLNVKGKILIDSRKDAL